MLQGRGATNENARKLRVSMSLPEVLLWRELRKRPAGLKFRRQHPADSYVLDFYCHEARLILEVDGAAHDMGSNQKRDQRRDQHFESKGLRTLRIPAADILRDVKGAVDGIIAAASTVGEEP